MIKVLSILVIITIGITGSAHLTASYMEFPISLLDTAVNLIDTIIPQNQFHVESPISSTKRNDGSVYSFPVDMGTVSGTLNNGISVNNASVFELLMERAYRYVGNGSNVGNGVPSEFNYQFPRPFLDNLNPETGEMYIYSVNWFPTLYEITGNYGEIAEGTNRTTLTALRVDVVYTEKNSILQTFLYGPYSGFETKSYYFILNNNPRVYEGTFSVISLVDGLYYFSVASYGDRSEPVYTERVRVTYVKNTLTTWKEYVEKELMR